jgi:hypothetical protein
LITSSWLKKGPPSKSKSINELIDIPMVYKNWHFGVST